MSKNWAEPKREYEKDPNLKPEEVQILLDWCKKQAYLPEISELQAILFLHSCFYRMEMAKTTVDHFYTIKTHCSELFTCPDEKVLQKTLDCSFIAVLDQRTSKGEAILVIKLLDTRIELFDCVDQIKSVVLTMILYLHQNGNSEGFQAVFDMSGISFAHLTRLNLGALKTFFYMVQEAVPLRLVAIHLVNISPVAEKIIGLVKPFLKKELWDLITMHQNFDSVFTSVPKELLPKDFGGTATSIAELQKERCKRMLDNLDFFQSLDLLVVDESQRPGKPKDMSAIFGMDGSFKKLDID